MGGFGSLKLGLKLWVKLGCSPRYTQMVPKGPHKSEVASSIPGSPGATRQCAATEAACGSHGVWGRGVAMKYQRERRTPKLLPAVRDEVQGAVWYAGVSEVGDAPCDASHRSISERKKKSGVLSSTAALSYGVLLRATATGEGKISLGKISPPLKSPKLQVPSDQMTAITQQDMPQTETPKLQHIATTKRASISSTSYRTGSTRCHTSAQATVGSGAFVTQSLSSGGERWNCSTKISPRETFPSFLNGGIFPAKFSPGEILLPSAVHLEERLTVSQSVPEPASRQSDRYTQFGFFVSGRCGPNQQRGNLPHNPSSGRVVTQPAGIRVVGGSNPSLPTLAPPPVAALKVSRSGSETTPAHVVSAALPLDRWPCYHHRASPLLLAY